MKSGLEEARQLMLPCHEEEEKEEDCENRKPQEEMLTLASQMVSGLGGERCTGPAPIVKMHSIRKIL